MANFTDPAKAAMPYLNNIPGTITPYYQPYIDTGNQAMQQFFNQISQLSNPQGANNIYNQFASGYQTSPGAQSAMNSARKQTDQLAAASGMFGTPSEQAAVGAQMQDISFKDFNDYMSQLMGLYSTGLQGEQGLTQLGYGASSELASDLAKNLMSQAGLKFAGVQGKNQFNANSQKNQADLIGALLGSLGSLGSFFKPNEET